MIPGDTPRPARAFWLVLLLPLTLACPASDAPAPGMPAAGETAPPAEGEATTAARGYFTAMHRTDWAAMTDWLHPDALDEFKRIILPNLLRFARQNPEQEQAVLGRFEGVDTLDVLAGLQARDFFVRFMTSYVSDRPHNARMLQSSETAVIGEVAEGHDRVHVVYRMRGPAGPGRFEEMGVLQVRRHDGGWRALLSDEVKAVAANPG